MGRAGVGWGSRGEMEGVEGSRWALIGRPGSSWLPPMERSRKRRLMRVMRRWGRVAVGVDWVVGALDGSRGGRNEALERSLDERPP